MLVDKDGEMVAGLQAQDCSPSEVKEDACLEALLVVVLGDKEVDLLLLVLRGDLVAAFAEGDLLLDWLRPAIKHVLAVQHANGTALPEDHAADMIHILLYLR